MENNVAYDLYELFRKGKRVTIKRCPRCGGSLYWPYRCTSQADFYKDKLKCFCCGRSFQLTRNSSGYVWKQYPDRDEEYAIVHEKF